MLHYDLAKSNNCDKKTVQRPLNRADFDQALDLVLSLIQKLVHFSQSCTCRVLLEARSSGTFK